MLLLAHCQSAPPQALPRAFTLIELLVVITVIALLIGILIPALASTRRHGRLLTCTANLRSQGQLVLSYVTDFRDAMPPNALQWNRLEDDGQYHLEFWNLPRFLALYNDTPWQYNPALGLPLVVPNGVWRCTEIKPEDDGAHTTHVEIIHSVSNSWLFNAAYPDDQANTSQIYYAALPGWDARLNNSWRRITEVNRPADMLTLCDAITFYFALHMHRHALESVQQAGQIATGTDPRDNRGSHESLQRLPTVYLDGHAGAIPLSQSYWFDRLQTYTAPDGETSDLYDREVNSLIWYVDPL